MNLSDLASIAGVLGSLAVFGSLIYLALQVRQTDRNQRTLLQQGASARNMESVWKFGEPHNAEIVARVWCGETDFTTTQATQLVYLLRASLLGFQDQFLLNMVSCPPNAKRNPGAGHQAHLERAGVQSSVGHHRRRLCTRVRQIHRYSAEGRSARASPGLRGPDQDRRGAAKNGCGDL